MGNPMVAMLLYIKERFVYTHKKRGLKEVLYFIRFKRFQFERFYSFTLSKTA